MRDDKKMLHIGAWIFGAGVLISIVIFPVVFRTQARQLNLVQREIVTLRQQIAIKEAEFASRITPEILRNSVEMVSPNAKTVAFSKTVWIGDLKSRKEQ
jgi:hypothetical protein